ncbi:hypothetical protein HGA88_02760 [Candidatus Roizmanbacteria bacterium]|nr:hypothetical protein [Candidatus Roizmanbacteria bacterium]
MNDKDKIIVKDSALVVAEAVVDEIAKLLPGINIAWGLSKALYGAGMKLRQERVLEWVEMVRDNPNVFTEQILTDEKFQDGFVIALEKYLTERDSTKRILFRNVFLGFANANDKTLFPLEKYIHTLSQLNQIDIETLRDVDTTKIGNLNYLIYGFNSNRKANIHNLIGLGLLFDTTGTRGGYNPAYSPFVTISPFGISFIEYLIIDK